MTEFPIAILRAVPSGRRELTLFRIARQTASDCVPEDIPGKNPGQTHETVNNA